MESDISVIIPTYNMSSHIDLLWRALVESNTAVIAQQIVFVDDGSTDETSSILTRLSSEPTNEAAKIKIIRLKKNQGRFLARYEGAKAADFEKILFLDTRLTLPKNFGDAILRLSSETRALMGNVDIDITRNLFCLYWDRSHRFIFSRHFRDTQKSLLLTIENYDKYLKGTTVFLCPKRTFLEACEKFIDQPLLNDDTYLLKEVVKTVPILIHPEVRIKWVPREDYKSFLKRLWERGPSFVEYHVFNNHGIFFKVVLAGVIATLGWLGLLYFLPDLALLSLGLVFLAVFLSTALFAKSIKEFIRLSPLHTAVVATFGAAILYGICVNSLRFLHKRRYLE